MLNITTATTAELVAFYNANAAAAVKKFADRKTAERRVSTLIESLQATKQVAAKKVYKTHEERSEAIAKSWLVPATADARTTRHAVEVVTPEGLKMGFRSTKEAFETLELPLGQHIRFRGQLKASKAKQFTSTDGVYQFAIAHEVIRAAA